jgi:glycosyltransferase involved in cell wall biosynthesis
VEKTLRPGQPVIVEDDGSTDSTPRILASLSGPTVIRHKENPGKGALLITGFTEADAVLCLDMLH